VAQAIGERTCGPVLLNQHGRRMTVDNGYRGIAKLARDAGISKRISPHSLRHTSATLMLDAGAPLHKVQDALGNAEPRTTRRYDRARGSLDDHASYALEGYLAGAS